MTRLSLLASITLALLAALFCTSPARATTPDGYFDLTFGTVAFPGDTDYTDSGTGVGYIAMEPGGTLFMAGYANFGGNLAKDYWWLGEMFQDEGGTWVPTFGVGNGLGRISSCHLGVACDFNASFTDRVRNALGQPDGRYVILSDRNAFSNDAKGFVTRTTAGAHLLDVPGVVGGSGYVDYTAYKFTSLNGHMLCCMPGGQQLTLTSNGKILVAGTAYYDANSSDMYMAVVRLNSDLSLDTGFHAVIDQNQVTFAGGARVGNPGGNAYAVLMQNDGSIILIGHAFPSLFPPGVQIVDVVHLTANGVLDGTFGNGGYTQVPDAAISTAMIDRSGRIVLAWNTTTVAGGLINRIRMARVNANALLDTFFSTDYHPAACDDLIVTSMAIDSAGRILVGGTCRVRDSQTLLYVRSYFLVTRFRGDTGAIDPTFGLSGVSLGWYDYASLFDGGAAIAFNGGGRLLVGGTSQPLGDTSHPVRSGISRLIYDLIFTNDLEIEPRGCLPPDCN